jgi:hypothetical protein
VEVQYCRARHALLTLRGPGSWEEDLKPLELSDVRALNKQELMAQEKEDICHLREKYGVVVEAEEAQSERVLSTVAAVGEGQRRPSWIWFTGNVHEAVDDPLTRAGSYIIQLVANP